MTDKVWRELLQAISVNGESMAEQSMEIAEKKGNKEDYQKAQSMRKAFQNITDSIKNNQNLTSFEYLYLLMSAAFVSEHIRKEINKKQIVVDEYETNIIPKLKNLAISTKKVAENFDAQKENNT